MSSYSISAVTGTAPLSVADLKDYLLVTHTGQDTEIQALIDSAIAMAEEVLGFHLVAKTVVERIKYFPTNGLIYLTFGKVASVSSITYYDTDEVQQNLDLNTVFIDTFSYEGIVELLPNQDWPSSVSTRRYPITVTYTTTDIDDNFIKLAIKKLVIDFYTRREDRIDVRTPQAISKLLRYLKLYKF